MKATFQNQKSLETISKCKRIERIIFLKIIVYKIDFVTTFELEKSSERLLRSTWPIRATEARALSSHSAEAPFPLDSIALLLNLWNSPSYFYPGSK